jgi:flagellar hook-basal body complex protein FliE
MSSIAPLGHFGLASPTGTIVDAAAPEAPQFTEFLLDSLRAVRAAQQRAELAMGGVTGCPQVGAADVLSAIEQADQAFHTVLQVRDKLAEAYEGTMDVLV